MNHLFLIHLDSAVWYARPFQKNPAPGASHPILTAGATERTIRGHVLSALMEYP